MVHAGLTSAGAASSPYFVEQPFWRCLHKRLCYATAGTALLANKAALPLRHAGTKSQSHHQFGFLDVGDGAKDSRIELV
jgi:hypothetical protein